MEARLQKILSAAGVASRRAAERLIRDGRVSVNNKTITELGTKADPARDVVKVDGRRIAATVQLRYILLHKPLGVVTTRSDPERRPTVISLLGGTADYVYPVGRLDYDSAGLLLLTNDGELAARLMHPRHEVPKVYRARVRGIPDAEAMGRLARGIPLDGHRTAPALVRRVDRSPTGRRGDAILEITLREGRNRQVRRMCEAVGHPVMSLERVQFGPLRDSRMKPGTFRELTPREVASLQQAVGLGPPGSRQDGTTPTPRVSAGARTRPKPRPIRPRADSSSRAESRPRAQSKPQTSSRPLGRPQPQSNQEPSGRSRPQGKLRLQNQPRPEGQPGPQGRPRRQAGPATVDRSRDASGRGHGGGRAPRRDRRR